LLRRFLVSNLSRGYKLLWARSGGICAFPACEQELVFGKETPIVLGEEAHVIARSPDGPRGHIPISEEERHTYQNLILLCPTHHTLVDKDRATWTAEKLYQMKYVHEGNVRAQVSKGLTWIPNFSLPDYVNVPRILFDLAAQDAIDDEILEALQNMQNVQSLLDFIYIQEVLLIYKKFLKKWKPGALDLADPETLKPENVGSRVKFNMRFRTKDIFWPDEEMSARVRNHKEPHIYCKVLKKKVSLYIDPRWITTSSAFLDFTSGQRVFSGIGILKHVEAQAARVTPLVVGVPMSPLDQAMYDSGLGLTIEDVLGEPRI
jgi:hypothetical protein